MKTKLVIAFIAVCVAAIGVATAQTSITLEELRRKSKAEPKPTPRAVEPLPDGRYNPDLLIKSTLMSEGSYSKIEKPFVFVARDAESYALLDSMIGDFEPVEVDFTKQAVVAAFSGEKETGGYSVSIKMREGKCEIEDVSPAHGAIVTDALTKPYALALIPVEEEAPLNISVSETWNATADRYRVVSGEFEFQGGFLGISKKFEVDGTISTMRYGDFVTMLFDIHEKGENSVRQMVEAASGIKSEKLPTLKRVEGGSLIDRPHPPLQVFAEIGDDQMSLKFYPGKRNYVISDGFEGKGTITAEVVVAP